MTIGLKSLYTPPPPEDRDIVKLEVQHLGNTYQWAAYVPRGLDLDQALTLIEPGVYADIEAKEAIWATHPKTKTVADPFTGEDITVEVQKEEIVCPDMPDYYARRRAEYPPLSDQLDAVWKGLDSPEYLAMIEKILEVKNKYPKPQSQ
jgi:hypothetical protein